MIYLIVEEYFAGQGISVNLHVHPKVEVMDDLDCSGLLHRRHEAFYVSLKGIDVDDHRRGKGEGPKGELVPK